MNNKHPAIFLHSDKKIFLFIGLVFLLVLVVFVLPLFIKTDKSETTIDKKTLNLNSELILERKIANDRVATQQFIREATEALNELKIMHIVRWEEKSYIALTEELKKANSHYRQKQYATAQIKLKSIQKKATQLKKNLPTLIDNLVSQGNFLLKQGKADEALIVYDNVLAADKNNKKAFIGRKKALSFDTVTSLLKQAESYEEINDLQAALKTYKRVNSLDPQENISKEKILILEKELTEIKISRLISKGYAYLDEKKVSQAKNVFLEIQEYTPKNKIAATMLRIISQKEVDEEINKEFIKFKKYKNLELWEDAIKSLTIILNLDSSLASLKEEKQYAMKRKEIETQLLFYTKNYGLLVSNRHKEQAKLVLSDSEKIKENKKALLQQTKVLKNLLFLSEKLIPVTLQSDNTTQVTLNKTISLGKFSKKVIKLKPGSYVISGDNPNCENININFDIKIKMNEDNIFVACEAKNL